MALDQVGEFNYKIANVMRFVFVSIIIAAHCVSCCVKDSDDTKPTDRTMLAAYNYIITNTDSVECIKWARMLIQTNGTVTKVYKNETPPGGLGSELFPLGKTSWITVVGGAKPSVLIYYGGGARLVGIMINPFNASVDDGDNADVYYVKDGITLFHPH